jgi:hypothetical protein
MKKNVFTLLTVFALAIMAGGAFAANETTVLPGGTYTYNLTGVLSANAATATVTYGGTGATVAQVGTTWEIPAIISSTVSFTIKYGTQLTPATSGDITVVITDGGCSNSIKLTITVQPLPTYTLALAKDETGYVECQARTGAGNNLTDARGTETNTFTFTVTPVVTGITGNFTYSYTIDLPSNANLLSFNNGSASVLAYSDGVVTYTGVTNVVTDVFTVSFKTTTGKATQTLAALVSIGAASTMTPIDGGGTYEAASGGDLSQTVTVKAVPTIGSFN